MSSAGSSNTKSASNGWEGPASNRQQDSPDAESGLGPSEVNGGSSLAMSLTSDEVNYLVFR